MKLGLSLSSWNGHLPTKSLAAVLAKLDAARAHQREQVGVALHAVDVVVGDPGHGFPGGCQADRDFSIPVPFCVISAYRQAGNANPLNPTCIIMPDRHPPSMTDSEVEFFKALGSRVSRLRKNQGLTQAGLAGPLGITQPMLASYEIGRRRIPASLLPALAHELRVPVGELLGERPKGAKPGPHQTPEAARSGQRPPQAAAAVRQPVPRHRPQPGGRGRLFPLAARFLLCPPPPTAGQVDQLVLAEAETIPAPRRHCLAAQAAWLSTASGGGGRTPQGRSGA